MIIYLLFVSPVVLLVIMFSKKVISLVGRNVYNVETSSFCVQTTRMLQTVHQGALEGLNKEMIKKD